MKPMINYYITFSHDVQSYICHRKLFYSDATAYSFLANRPEQGVKRLIAIAVHPVCRGGSRICRYAPIYNGYRLLHYDGICWNESDEQALAVVQELTDRQLQEAETAEHVAWQKLKQSGGSDVLVGSGAAKAKKLFDAAQLAAFTQYAIAKEYKTFVIKRRDTKYLNSCLQAAKPMLQCKPTELDNNEFLLNTPLGTYYLPDGLCGIHPSTATDKITKVTEVSPGDNGKNLWRSAINTFFCKDAELIEYVQQIVGLAAIGKVYVEALIIAYGEGRNGKSTFWNVISRVLGTYSGNISADTLTVGCRRNVKPEMAEAKGKRLLIAAELDEGMRLNTSIIKQLCSTDAVFAEKKYKDPFQFIPSHTLVLYTNHLPRVGANDPSSAMLKLDRGGIRI